MVIDFLRRGAGLLGAGLWRFALGPMSAACSAEMYPIAALLLSAWLSTAELNPRLGRSPRNRNLHDYQSQPWFPGSRLAARPGMTNNLRAWYQPFNSSSKAGHSLRS